MPGIISETLALEIAREFADEITHIAPVRAVYLIGSLGGGYYRPGQSDIDTAVILNCTRPDIALYKPGIKALAAQYRDRYGVPKDFGAVVMSADQLFPPYIPEEELVPEIMRIKLQGRLIHGESNSSEIPLPDMDAARACENAFENWRASGFRVPPEKMTLTMTVNSILLLLRRYLMLEKGVMEFNKRQLIPLYLRSQPPMTDERILRAIERCLAGEDPEISDDFLLEMSLWHEKLLTFMNARLLGR